MEVFNYLERPSGQNVVVAILSFQRYNMEDAIIINRASVDRGLFRSTFYRIYEAESRQYLGGLRDKFEIPEAGIRGYRGDRYYRLIEEDGIISPEAEATGNTVLVGRTSPPRFMEEYREVEAKGPRKPDEAGTAFENIGAQAIGDMLSKLGFQKSGREPLYTGIPGERLAAELFIGVVYSQKLPHMVADKMHARARGQVQMLTRQPTEGRARGGGLRFGEMERDCLIGHGASALLRDRLLEESDKYTAYVCEICGTLAYYDIKQNKYICRIDGEKATISPVSISYAFKLLVQELMSLGIVPRLSLQERA